MDEKLLYRSFRIEAEGEFDSEERTVELSFSSETPVERSFGNEVLDHSADSVDLSRINSAAPLLLEHDRTQQIGVVERAWIDEEDKKGRAVVRFSRSDLGQSILTDVRDGVRQLISFGYEVRKFTREVAKEGMDTFRATSWLPMEISVVSIPADINVGVGRAYPEQTTAQENLIMEEPIQQNEAHEELERTQEVKPEVRIEVRPDKRAEDIANLGDRFDAKDEAIQHIKEGRSLDDFKSYLMERNASQPLETLQGDEEIGMSQQERKQYSLVSAIRSHANGKLEGIELEAHRELEKRFDKPAQGFYVPNDVLYRDLTATDSGDTGDKLIATELGAVIEPLRNVPILQQLGARVLSGLSSNVSIPKAGNTTAYWTGENTAATESTPTLGSITLSPKRVAGYTEVSKQLLMQSNIAGGVEAMLREDILFQLNLAIDAAGIDGGGTNEPAGILDNSDINSVTMSGSTPTFAEVVEAEQKILEDNAQGSSMAVLTTPAMAAGMKTTTVDSGSGRFVLQDGQVNGYRAVVSNQMTASTLVQGDFSQVILANFGAGADITTDATTLALQGLVRIHAARYVDSNLRHPQAFCKIA